MSLFIHISLLCGCSFWILNRSDCCELYIKMVKLTLIVVFLHEEKQLIASFESLVSSDSFQKAKSNFLWLFGELRPN